MIDNKPFKAEDYVQIYPHAVDETARRMSAEEVYSVGQFHEAGHCGFTGWLGDTPLGCLGIDTVRPGVGQMWSIINTEVRGHIIESMRATKMMLNIIEEDYDFKKLRSESRIGFPESQRFLEFLGFTRSRRTIMQGTHFHYTRLTCHH